MQLFYHANVPVNQNLLYKTAEAAKNAISGDLDIQNNEDTGLISNSAFNVDFINYSEDYNNNQYHSEYINSYIHEQIEWLIANYMQKAKTIVEVGCGR